MKHVVLLLALAGPVLSGPARAEDPATPSPAQKVIECMRANVPKQLTIQDLQFTIFDRVGGDRPLKGRLYSRKEEVGGLMNATLQIDAPVEFKGAAYLVRETSDYLRDGMFVYLPTVKRVRRVSGTFADASLLGTNFSYFDFKQLQNAFGDLSATLEKTEPVNGRPTHVLSFEPVAGAETHYTKVKTWVDQEACVGVKAEFYEGNRLAKVLTSPEGSLKKAGNTWYVNQMEMKDPVAGTRTILKMGKLDAEREVPKRMFDATSFYLGP